MMIWARRDGKKRWDHEHFLFLCGVGGGKKSNLIDAHVCMGKI